MYFRSGVIEYTILIIFTIAHDLYVLSTPDSIVGESNAL